VDVQTIDMSYSQLQSESQQTVAALSALAQKLQTAAQNGDPNAREWMLDLKEVALGIQNEQNQTSNLLQALHNFVANQLQQPRRPTSSRRSCSSPVTSSRQRRARRPVGCWGGSPAAVSAGRSRPGPGSASATT